MKKLNSIDDLLRLKSELSKQAASENGIKVKVACATCGIASGAKEVLTYMSEELEKRNIEASVILTGCMGYCYAEPTVEITLPGKKPVVFGYVDIKKADAIIEKYIKNEQLLEGIIPLNYRTIDEY